jgi:hypothetical protein
MQKKPQEEFRRMLARAKLMKLQLEADSARGVVPLIIAGEQVEAPVAFKMVESRWFLHVAQSEDSPVDASFLAPIFPL